MKKDGSDSDQLSSWRSKMFRLRQKHSNLVENYEKRESQLKQEQARLATLSEKIEKSAYKLGVAEGRVSKLEGKNH